MKARLLTTGGLAASLCFALSTLATAQPVRVFSPPKPGHARPPLWINLRPNSVSSPSAAPYTPQQVQAAYGFSAIPNYPGSLNGAGQTIGIVDAYDDTANIQSDLNTFCTQFGLPLTTVQIIYAQGSKPSPNTGWQEEMSLDVEWAHAIAPGAKILLVEAADNSTAHLLQAVQAAVNYGATVVSMSWGGGEYSGETTDDSTFTAPNVTYVASAGDSGEGSSVEWPAASPNVVSVGGTTLTLNSSGGYASEAAWSSSGGGISIYEKPQPAWQNGWFQTAWTPVNRGVPDVSYLADPNYGVYVAYKGQWYEFGGTSVGAPQWAALIALANQGRTAALVGTDQALYSIAKGSGTTTYGGLSINAANFHDVTSGNDGSDQDDAAYTGYDLVTGVGSPVAGALVPALNAWGSASSTPDFTITVSPSSQTVAPGGGAWSTVTVSGSGGYSGTVSLSVSGSGFSSQSFSPQSISGSGSATLSVTAGATPGTFPLTITGTDSASSLTHSVNATLVVATTPTTMTVSSIAYSTSGARHSNLNITLTVVNNAGSPVANASVTVTLDLNGAAYTSGSGTTGSNGQTTFQLQRAPAGTYSTVVTAVTAAGLNWDDGYPANSYYDRY